HHNRERGAGWSIENRLPARNPHKTRASPSFANLAAATDNVLIAGQLFKTHRSTCMKLVRAYPNFRAETEFAPVGKPGRGVPVDSRGIDLPKKPLRPPGIGGNNGVAVMRAVTFDVLDRLIQIVHHADGHDLVQIFGLPVLLF